MRRAVLALILVCIPLAIYAQSPGPPPPEVVANFLVFSDAQRAEFQQLLQNFQEAAHSIQQQASQKQAEVEALLNADAPDPAAVGVALLQLRAIQKQMGRVMEAYHSGFVALLTEEQKRKVHAVAQAARLLPAVQAFVGLQLIPPPQ